MATIKKNEQTKEIIEKLEKTEELKTPKIKEPKQANRSKKAPKTKTNLDELVMCQGLFVMVARRDMSKKYGGKYSQAFLKSKGL